MSATIAVLSPGDMGHAVGGVLVNAGHRVITCLAGRTPRTRDLARDAGIADVADLDALVREADLVLSILVPAAARELADRLAVAVRRTGSAPLIVDCNAIAPQTARAIGEVLTAAGARFADGGIIGPAPRAGSSNTRIYVSGADAESVLDLVGNCLDVRVVGPHVGQASGLKMCYAALTKGLTALVVEQQVTARTLGLTDQLRAELEMSQPELLRWASQMVPSMPPRAGRWVGEMEQIASTFAAAGLPPEMMVGAARLYALAAAGVFAQETPESRKLGLSTDEVAEILAGELAPHKN